MRFAKILAATAVVVLAALILLGLAQSEPRAIPSGLAGESVAVDGIPIRKLQRGVGRDVLLIHGSPGTLEDWEPVFDRLATRYRVTAYDRPGHGFSGGADRPHTPQVNAAVALALIRALGLTDVIVVGHSFGGSTALALALQRPAELRAIIVIGSNAHGPVRVDPLFRLLTVPVLGRGAAAALAPFVGPSRIETGVRASFGPNAGAIPSDFVARRTPIWTRPTVTTTLAQEHTGLAAALDEMSARYGSIRVPVTAVYGDQDRNHADGVRLAREIVGARLLSLERTGHYVQFARPERLIAAIDEAAGAR